MSEPIDVAIIGGGPAGAAAARCLASWGHTTVLFARRASGRALAESLPPSCLGLLDRIGVRAAVEAAGFVRATGNTVWWGNEPARAERFGEGALGFQVDRAVFDRVLVEQAASAGAMLLSGAVLDVSSGSAEDEPWLVRYERGGAEQRLRARWVLDCSGRAGLIARRGWRRPESGARTLALTCLWDAANGFGLDDDTHTLVESYEGGWAWSVPVRSTRRYFTVMVDPALIAVSGSDLSATYLAELDRTRHLRAIVRHAVLAEMPWARDASPYSTSRAGAPGMLLVGDAASFVDPLSSFGVKKALASAWLASVVVHTCLSDPAMVAPALELFERRERAMYESLAQRSAALAREASDAHANSFWSARAMSDTRDVEGDADIVALRQDVEVLAAFGEIRRRPSISLRRSDAVSEVQSPTVRDNRIVLEPHLSAPGLGSAARYLRNVDLVTLARLAPAHDQVPALYDAYNRAQSPAPLPDFLGALSVLVAKGVLVLDDRR